MISTVSLKLYREIKLQVNHAKIAIAVYGLYVFHLFTVATNGYGNEASSQPASVHYHYHHYNTPVPSAGKVMLHDM